MPSSVRLRTTVEVPASIQVLRWLVKLNGKLSWPLHSLEPQCLAVDWQFTESAPASRD